MILIISIFTAIVAMLIIPVFVFNKEDDLKKVGFSLDNRMVQLKQNYQFELKELNRKVHMAEIDDSEYEQFLNELKTETASSVDATQKDKSTMNVGKSKLMIVAIMIFTLVTGTSLYYQTGEMDYAENSANISKFLLADPNYVDSLLEKASENNNDQKALNDLLLAVRLQVELKPKEAKTWSEYGRVYSRLGESDQAVKAFNKARQLDPSNAEIQLELAQTLASSDNSELKKHAISIMQQIIKEHPDHQRARLFLGFTAYQQKDFQLAIDAWDGFLKIAKADSPIAKMIKLRIDKANSLLSGGLLKPVMPAHAQLKTADKASLDSKPLVINLEIDESIKKQLTGEEILFVFAKAEVGPRMPLAVFRKKYKDFDGKISLSDADAMQPQLKLSNFKNVKVIARLSKTGSAIGSKGDFEGVSEIIHQPFPESVKLTINKTL